jgi:hypothetical protein
LQTWQQKRKTARMDKAEMALKEADNH